MQIPGPDLEQRSDCLVEQDPTNLGSHILKSTFWFSHIVCKSDHKYGSKGNKMPRSSQCFAETPTKNSYNFRSLFNRPIFPEFTPSKTGFTWSVFQEVIAGTRFLQAGCPSSHPTNSDIALTDIAKQQKMTEKRNKGHSPVFGKQGSHICKSGTGSYNVHKWLAADRSMFTCQ